MTKRGVAEFRALLDDEKLLGLISFKDQDKIPEEKEKIEIDIKGKVKSTKKPNSYEQELKQQHQQNQL